MRLNIRTLKNVANVNNWQYVSQATIQEGQVNEFYIRLVDFDMVAGSDKSVALPENPLRYIPQGTVVTLQAIFPSIDNAQELTINATQPFATDKSIWKISLLSTQLPKSGNFKLVLTEDAVVKNILAKNAIVVDLLNIGSC